MSVFDQAADLAVVFMIFERLQHKIGVSIYKVILQFFS